MYDIFKVEHTVYNKKLVNSLVLKIKATMILIAKKKNSPEDKKKISIYVRMKEDKVANMKLKVFNMMSKVVTKNINNYLNLAYNSPIREEAYTREEMQGEAWLVFCKCIEKFKNGNNCFYFYFNKAMGRNFYKMFFNAIKAKDKHQKWQKEHKYTKPKITFGMNGIDMLVDQMKFTEEEEVLVLSKIKNEKKQSFLENNPDFAPAKYYSTLQRIKSKIEIFKENGYL